MTNSTLVCVLSYILICGNSFFVSLYVARDRYVGTGATGRREILYDGRYDGRSSPLLECTSNGPQNPKVVVDREYLENGEF